VPAAQGVHALAPAGEYVPAPHVWHCNRPTVGACLPAAHCAQLPAPVMLEAVRTGQDAHALAPASE
jgi:hypothetical protein